VVEFFSQYGLFLAEAVTVLVVVLLIVGGIASAASGRPRKESKGNLSVRYLNDEYDDLKHSLEEAVLDKTQLKKIEKDLKKEDKQKKKDEKKSASSASSTEGDDEKRKKRIYVLDFDGDVKASGSEELALEITAVLSMAEKQDEIVLRLESPGGMVHAYGLTASQLERIKKKGISLTIAVDHVAASGGYMMACLANKIIAAPFAIVGSIGVLAQIPNFHRLLKKHDIDVELLTAGEYKTTLTTMGEITEKGRKKFVEELEDTHVLFKEFVKGHRPSVDIDKIATGEHWYGSRALDLNLIDEVMTSDEYLTNAANEADLYAVAYDVKKPWNEKFAFGMQGALDRMVEKWLYSGNREIFK